MNAMARAMTIRPAATVNVIRIPAMTDSAGAVKMLVAAAPRANTVPISDAPVISPRLRDRLSIPEMTPRLSGVISVMTAVQKLDKDSALLREGTIDLETGVVGTTMGPEIRAQALFRDRFVGVVRMGHSLCQGEITPARYATGRPIGISRQGLEMGVIDEAVTQMGLQREITTVVGGFSTAVALAGGHTFPLPVRTPEFTVSLLWHPRFHADPPHRWRRGIIRETCAAV